MKFLVDRMLGKLAKDLRMLGYDAVYYRGEETQPLFQLARQEGRVILTRNTRLIPKRPEDQVCRLTEDNPSLQLQELIQKRHLSLNEENPFLRCLLCNNVLDHIPRERAEGKVPDFIFHQKKAFFRCPSCQRIYWQGSHLEKMQKKIEQLRLAES